jgi:hypothetical protein
MPKQRLALLVLGFCSTTGHPARAAEGVAACIDANEQTQIAERAGRLREALALARSCDVPACPALVRTDCARLESSLAASIPTLIVDVAGADPQIWRVWVDGAYPTEAREGRPLELDPGVHRVRLETRAGAILEEHEVVLRQGEHDRRVTFVPREAPAAASRERWPSVTGWILGGVAGAAGATFAFFALSGQAKESSLAGSCAPRCTSHELAPLHAEYLVANVSLAVAIAAALGVVGSVWVGR